MIFRLRMEAVPHVEIDGDVAALAWGARISEQDMVAWDEGDDWSAFAPATRRLFQFEAYYARILLTGELFTHDYPAGLIVGGGRFQLDPETEAGVSVLDPGLVRIALEFIRSISRPELVRKHGGLVLEENGGPEDRDAQSMLSAALGVFDSLEIFYANAALHDYAVISVLDYP